MDFLKFFCKDILLRNKKAIFFEVDISKHRMKFIKYHQSCVSRICI